jgi:hypothetical protein
MEPYNSFGKAYHSIRNHSAISQQGMSQHLLPSSFLQVADDEIIDIQLQRSIDNAVAVVGKNIGVSTIAFQNGQYDTSFYGPIL